MGAFRLRLDTVIKNGLLYILCFPLVSFMAAFLESLIFPFASTSIRFHEDLIPFLDHVAHLLNVGINWLT
jgi:hypothetical protein